MGLLDFYFDYRRIDTVLTRSRSSFALSKVRRTYRKREGQRGKRKERMAPTLTPRTLAGWSWLAPPTQPLCHPHLRPLDGSTNILNSWIKIREWYSSSDSKATSWKDGRDPTWLFHLNIHLVPLSFVIRGIRLQLFKSRYSVYHFRSRHPRKIKHKRHQLLNVGSKRFQNMSIYVFLMCEITFWRQLRFQIKKFYYSNLVLIIFEK